MMNRPQLPGLPKITVNSIFCIGRNYAEHARELNNPVPKSPVVFTKPASSLIFDGDAIVIPEFTEDVHHELEMVVAIGETGKNIPAEQAQNHIAGYAIGLDMTARDVQSRLKEKSHPWDLAKGPDTFAPLGNFVEATQVNPADIHLSLKRNGTFVQQGTTSDMIFSVHQLISHLSKYFTLNPGDLIYTGTPEGVGPVQKGDQLEAVLGDNLSTLSVSVT